MELWFTLSAMLRKKRSLITSYSKGTKKGELTPYGEYDSERWIWLRTACAAVDDSLKATLSAVLLTMGM